ncbi:MAG: MtN3 and saliva related transrane protein [Thermodesulfobacteriota bacterium]|nr:MtN3 and saliva related transrane protein [Thermodesulfobacteriota bacterium]
MVPDSVIITANACQIATTFISLSAYLPQWIKLIKTKSSADIALKSWCIWIVAATFTLFYAIVQFLLNGRGWPLIISAAASMCCILFTIILVVRFRPPEAGKGMETG